ncbi:MAG: OmpA family protein [Proteobacteria bacterium]|nr:OmpA family protein [Pseudomonadota bacterium]
MLKKSTIIPLLIVLMLVPVWTMTLVSCASKEVKQNATGMSDEEKARLEAERRAAEEAARRKAMEEETLRAREAEARDLFLNQNALFDFDKFDIRPDAETVLRQKADYMSSHGSFNVQIQGHCDERGTETYNLALGARRAESAKNFVESLGVSSGRLATESFGESQPIDPGHNEEAWAKNRRAQFAIVGQ